MSCRDGAASLGISFYIMEIRTMKPDSKLKLTRIKPGYYTALNGNYILYRAVNNMWKVRKNGNPFAILQAPTLGLLRDYYNQHGRFC